MRPSRTVARAALTAALALAALPGLVGSREPSPPRLVDAALFEQVNLATQPERQDFLLEVSGLSDGAIDPGDVFAEGGTAAVATDDDVGARGDRPRPDVGPTSASWTWRPPRFSLAGYASFYDFGTTAMREVPRGTVIVICGDGGCIERTVTDFGPAARTGRVIDMYRPDFFAICGCGWWSGTSWVTVRVY